MLGRLTNTKHKLVSHVCGLNLEFQLSSLFLNCDLARWWVVDKTIVPSNNHRITPSHWHCTHLPCKDSNPGSGKRQLAVSGNALDHTAIGAGPKWWETASSQWQCLKDHISHQGRALSGERQRAVSGNALDHMAIGAGPQWQETASSKWQRLRPHSHQGRPSVVREQL